MSDKMLVLIDGRSVYTPLFAGVYWDMQAVLPEDIERIEVISGPGAALWGANAVNGVINIITRSAGDTPGGTLVIGAGNLERMAGVQYGGRLSDDLSYRIHVEGTQFTPFKTASGVDAEDGWSTPQGGFRVDWTPERDHVTAEGEIFHDDEVGGNAAGRNFDASWQHPFEDGSTLQIAGYYDDSRRSADNGLGFDADTYNLEFQHDFSFAQWNAVVWGGGDRVIAYRFANTEPLAFAPGSRTLDLANVFAQDTISLLDPVRLTVGLKLENEPYSGLQAMPSVRLSWKVTDTALLWAAGSRAVRAPTPVDEDIVETLGKVDFLNGSHAFMPEVVTAWEIGTRVQPTSRLSFSVSGFYDVYSDLRRCCHSAGAI
jgi:iron complex outermembrane receptor protein